MSDLLKNRLLKHEVPPPPSSWDNISAQLDRDYTNYDAVLSEKLENFPVRPPAMSWKNIAAQLDNNDAQARKTKVIPLVYRRLAAAAVIISLISIFAVYLLNSKTSSEGEPVITRSSIVPHSIQPSIELNDSINSVVSSLRASTAANTKHITKKRVVRNAAIHDFSSYADFDIDDLKPVQVISALEPIQIDAPPIRDAGGNLIMDYALITSPDEPYIIVTSPNGRQTKISTKFLDCLSYLNDNIPSSEINYEGQEWKSRFKEWREKLSEAGYVPSANNFFDIFELQELITD